VAPFSRGFGFLTGFACATFLGFVPFVRHCRPAFCPCGARCRSVVSLDGGAQRSRFVEVPYRMWDALGVGLLAASVRAVFLRGVVSGAAAQRSAF